MCGCCHSLAIYVKTLPIVRYIVTCIICYFCVIFLLSCRFSEIFTNTIVCVSMVISIIIDIVLIHFPLGPIRGGAHSLDTDRWLLWSVGPMVTISRAGNSLLGVSATYRLTIMRSILWTHLIRRPEDDLYTGRNM